MNASLVTEKLSKGFGDFTAVDHLDLTHQPGRISGLLGPTAAGKTTTIHMLAGVIRPTSGSAMIHRSYKTINRIYWPGVWWERLPVAIRMAV
jgi:ABC-2 type transport system ATP-binding protein